MGYAMPYHNSYEIFEEIRRANPYYAGITYERLEREGSIFWPCLSEDHPGTPVLYERGFDKPYGARFYMA
jgi:formate dehydrogenase major subunit